MATYLIPFGFPNFLELSTADRKLCIDVIYDSMNVHLKVIFSLLKFTNLPKMTMISISLSNLSTSPQTATVHLF